MHATARYRRQRPEPCERIVRRDRSGVIEPVEQPSVFIAEIATGHRIHCPVHRPRQRHERCSRKRSRDDTIPPVDMKQHDASEASFQERRPEWQELRRSLDWPTTQ